ncbi:AIM18 Altered inheritance of mitochondria protein 18 [Candida maltosa Xu316]
MFRYLRYSRPALALTALFVTPLFQPQIFSEVNQIVVDSSLTPFPAEIKKSTHFENDFKLLGHGMRSVTFVSFKVYGVGLYIAEKDIPKASKILTSLSGQIEDPVQSVQVVEKLLDNDVKFLVRLSPVRNTDFNHLKDGLIKSILAHPKSKEIKEELAPGLDQLRKAFSRKGSVPKNHLLYLEIIDGGKLSVSYDHPGKEFYKMGVVESPLISRQLFLQYLSGPKPLSESLRQSCVKGFIDL